MSEINPFKEKFEVLDVDITEIKFKVKAKFFGVEKEFEFAMDPKEISRVNDLGVRVVIELKDL